MSLHFPARPFGPDTPSTWIHIPKTGGTSFRNWIRTNNIACEHSKIHATLDAVRSIWPDLGFVWAFVRNPWDRMVSSFAYVGQGAEYWLNLADQGRGNPKIDLDVEREIVKVYRQGFYYWLTMLEQGSYTGYDLSKTLMHIKQPQYHWLKGQEHCYIKIENLQSHLPAIQWYYDCQAAWPHVNTSDRAHYHDYYNDTTRKIVANLFEQDIDAYEYQF